MGQATSSSPFGRYSTAEEVVQGVNLEGKNIIVTGCNTGIGLETARVLAQRGAHVIMACRDVNKTEAIAEGLRKDAPGGVEVGELNLADLASVRKFAESFNASNRPLHVLINNAGVMACPYMKTVDGFENQFGTNHLGHFLLTNLLLPRLKEGAPSRVVSVSSEGHKFGSIRFDDLQFEKGYSSWGAYGQSKTANILFAQELAKRYAKDGIYAYSLHPGAIIDTDLARHFALARVPGVRLLLKPFEWLGASKSIPQGAATQVYLATGSDLESANGTFFYDCHQGTPAAHATNEETASKLWEVSSKLVKL